MNAESRGGATKSIQYGQYTVVRELGRGGMASVYEGLHVELGKRAAIKVMFPSLATSSTAATRFLREARSVAKLRHPHIVDVFDTGTTDDGTPFFVMELLEGQTLAGWLAERGPLSPEPIAAIFLPVLSAVANAHREGVIHRDLKPANIFLASQPTAVPHPTVLDFGISKVVADTEAPSLTRSESLIGTVHYMSPEQTRGGSTATALSDQYSIGVMLYECATGRRPFSGASPYELMHAIVTAPIAPPSALNPELPPEFDELVLRAMNRDPERRYPSVHALGNALLSFAGKLGWSLWGREFAGNATLDAGQAVSDAAPATDPDLKPPSGDTRAPQAPPHRRAASFWLMAGLAAYGLFCTALLLEQRRDVRSNAERPTVPPSASLPVSVPPPATPLPSSSAIPPPAPSASESVSGPAVSISTKPAHSPARPVRESTKAEVAPRAASSAEGRATEMGTNSALIIP